MRIPKVLSLILALSLVGVVAAGCSKKAATHHDNNSGSDRRKRHCYCFHHIYRFNGLRKLSESIFCGRW